MELHSLDERDLFITGKLIKTISECREKGIRVTKVFLPATMNVMSGIEQTDGYEFYGLPLGMTDNKNPELVIEINCQ